MAACLYCFFLMIVLYINGVTGSWFANDAAVNIDEDVLDIQSETIARKKFDFIFPGTKWCGKGDIAKNYEDLGSARETDMCCREHDHCTDLILAGETKHGLTNDAFYTRLNCKCDETFRLCLNKANTKTSRRIGKIYFNALGTKCYRRDYPVVGCNTYGGSVLNLTEVLSTGYRVQGRPKIILIASLKYCLTVTDCSERNVWSTITIRGANRSTSGSTSGTTPTDDLDILNTFPDAAHSYYNINVILLFL
uniref:Phospholipase A2 n=1 Tax=Bombyx mori TaxID=7091 RepID=A0A8R2R3C3_BOMMO|nr:uncharacterized protein LOC101746486 isoform X1 [Bombyx mori]